MGQAVAADAAGAAVGPDEAVAVGGAAEAAGLLPPDGSDDGGVEDTGDDAEAAAEGSVDGGVDGFVAPHATTRRTRPDMMAIVLTVRLLAAITPSSGDSKRSCRSSPPVSHPVHRLSCAVVRPTMPP